MSGLSVRIRMTQKIARFLQRVVGETHTPPLGYPPHLVGEASRFWKELRSAVAGALDAELVHAMAKRVGMEIQDSRRTLRPLHHSA
jgi:hypothetical protein